MTKKGSELETGDEFFPNADTGVSVEVEGWDTKKADSNAGKRVARVRYPDGSAGRLVLDAEADYRVR